MSTLNIFEMARLLGLDTAELLKGEDQAQKDTAKGALAAVDFQPASPANPGTQIRVRRHHWKGAFSMKIPAQKSADV